MIYDDMAFSWPCGEPPDANDLRSLMAVMKLSNDDGLCVVPENVLAELQVICIHASRAVGKQRALFVGLVPAMAAWRGVLATGQMQWLTSINGDGEATFFPCVHVAGNVDETTQRVTRFTNYMLELTFTELRTRIPSHIQHVRTHIEQRMRTLLPVIANMLDTAHAARWHMTTPGTRLACWVTHGLPRQCMYTFKQA